MVVKVRMFDPVEDSEKKGRRLFWKPTANCSKDASKCNCAKSHPELQHAASIRPPFVNAAQLKKEFHQAPNLKAGMMELHSRYAQKFDACCDSDEVFLQTTTSSCLPTYKKQRTTTP